MYLHFRNDLLPSLDPLGDHRGRNNDGGGLRRPPVEAVAVLPRRVVVGPAAAVDGVPAAGAVNDD